MCRKLYRNFASTNADNETYCTVLLTSQVVMVQSLQPAKGCEFESTCVLAFFPLFDSFKFIYYICTTTSELFHLDHYISKG